MSDLLNCPFCGGKAELDTQQHYTYMKHGQPRTGTRVVIYCLECSADMGICHEDDECADSEGVTTLWNARTEQALALRGEPVAWFKHGPYEEGEKLTCVFEDPNDEVCYSALIFAAPISGERATRDWTEDYAHENGNYQCLCGGCGQVFYGHKRRVTCKLCAAVSGERVREACAKVCDGIVADNKRWGHHGFALAATQCATAIRALPLAAQPGERVREALEMGLDKFMTHASDCKRYLHPNSHECSCGFDEWYKNALPLAAQPEGK